MTVCLILSDTLFYFAKCTHDKQPHEVQHYANEQTYPS